MKPKFHKGQLAHWNGYSDNSQGGSFYYPPQNVMILRVIRMKSTDTHRYYKVEGFVQWPSGAKSLRILTLMETDLTARRNNV